jgi:hypothetical protein
MLGEAPVESSTCMAHTSGDSGQADPPKCPEGDGPKDNDMNARVTHHHHPHFDSEEEDFHSHDQVYGSRLGYMLERRFVRNARYKLCDLFY